MDAGGAEPPGAARADKAAPPIVADKRSESMGEGFIAFMATIKP
jgi:hypothetical protein